MKPDTATIEIPRLADETPKAYAARVEYLTMGPERSLDKLVGHVRGKSGASNTVVENWSVKYGWQKSARDYDETVATLAAQAHAATYRRDLEEHRTRYKQAGDELYKIARAQMIRISKQLNETGGRATTIKDADIATNLRTLAGVLTTAADLEAHALRLEELMPSLTHDSE